MNAIQHCTKCGWLVADCGQTLCQTCWIHARGVTEIPAGLQVGKEVYVAAVNGTSAILKRKERNSYTLRKVGVPTHCRFGTLKQIREDVAHFVMCGSLPISGPRW